MKVLLIGGNQGLGKDLKEKLQDHDVLCLSRKTTPMLDLAWKEEDIKSVVKNSIKTLGGLDTLIVSSGMGAYHWPLVSQETVEDLMKVNFIGPTTVYKACLKALLKSSGKALFITSIAGRRPGDSGLSYYGATKAAINSWVMTEGKRAARHGIALYAVAPGFFDSPMTDEINCNTKSKSTKAIPYGRFGTTLEVSDYVINTLSQSNWCLAGSVFEISGGA